MYQRCATKQMKNSLQRIRFWRNAKAKQSWKLHCITCRTSQHVDDRIFISFRINEVVSVDSVCSNRPTNWVKILWEHWTLHVEPFVVSKCPLRFSAKRYCCRSNQQNRTKIQWIRRNRQAKSMGKLWILPNTTKCVSDCYRVKWFCRFHCMWHRHFQHLWVSWKVFVFSFLLCMEW